MCKLLTFPHFPSVGKLKTIFKIIFKTIFSFGIGLLLAVAKEEVLLTGSLISSLIMLVVFLMDLGTLPILKLCLAIKK